MALNITFDGFAKLNDGSTLADGNLKYQAYFYKVNAGSSSSKWNDVRIVESGASAGYYSLNLGDADFLSQTGNAADGDKIFIVFWKPISVDRNDLCISMEEWGAFEITLGIGPGKVSSDIYTNQAQVKYNIDPNLVWDLPATGYINTNYTATNNSYDEHTWNFGSVTMRHELSRYGQIIQAINTVSGTQYDWNDGYKDLGLIGASNRSHQWTAPGVYDVEIVITDECNATVTGTKQIQIYSPAPTPGIICHQAVGQNINTPDTVVTFAFDGTDTEDSIISINWIIEDTGSYGNTTTTVTGTSKIDTISHTEGLGTDWFGHSATSGAFTNPGSHTVSIVINWWDGFENKIINYNEVFNQLKFSGPTIDFTQYPAQATVSSGVKFTNTSSNTSRVGTGDGTEYDWKWTDGINVEQELNKSYSYELVKTPTTDDCEVKLSGHWQDGWDNKLTCKTKDVVFVTTVTVTLEECYYNLNITGTSSDGSVTGYNWEIYQDTSTSGTGPWDLTWESPVGMDQNDKKLCFTAIGYYKIVGYVYGSGATTSDYEYLHILEVCPEGEIIAVPVCEPEISSDERGLKYMDAEELKPGMRAISETVLPPVIEAKPIFNKLDMDTEELKPSMKAFPDPLI